jgi:hypothetical protein
VSLNYPVPLSGITPLLPQLTSLIIFNTDRGTIAQCVALSTSLKLLSLSLSAIGYLRSDTQAVIRTRIKVVRIVIDSSSDRDDQTALSAIINGSRVMKKILVDGSKSSSHGATMKRTMKILVPVCKKAKVELLWKVKLKVVNGKVDLNLK